MTTPEPLKGARPTVKDRPLDWIPDVLADLLTRLILTDPFNPAIGPCCDLLAKATIDPVDPARSLTLVEAMLRAVVDEARRHSRIRRPSGEAPRK